MTAYYNEFDPFAAAWIRNLIAAGHLPAGDVDERSIVDVRADDLKGYTQCHFFAGIGGWAHALRLAGWPDDRPVWTGSCPCQPFSAAGKGDGFADPRHLWPDFFRLIRERRPGVIFGEQVASKDGLMWLDLVQSDLEGAAHAFAAFDLGAAGLGAPHIRQRLWWVADATGGRGWAGLRPQGSAGYGRGIASNDGAGRELGDASGSRLSLCQQQDAAGEGRRGQGRAAQQSGGASEPVADAISGGCGECEDQQRAAGGGALRHDDVSGRDRGLANATDRQLQEPGRGSEERDGAGSVGEDDTDSAGWPGPTNGFWRDADWLLCRDGKWRPVEPGSQPLAHGVPHRVGRLRGYGNAIVPQVAAEVIGAFLELEQVEAML